MTDQAEKRGRTLPKPPMRWVAEANAAMRPEGKPKITKRVIAEAANMSEFQIGRALNEDPAKNVPTIEAIEAISRYLGIRSPISIIELAMNSQMDEGAADAKTRINRNVRLLRERAGYDVEGAADVANVPYDLWLSWERGEASPGYDELALVAKTLGHDPGHFWMESPPATSLEPHENLWARRRLRGTLSADVQERVHRAEKAAALQVLELSDETARLKREQAKHMVQVRAPKGTKKK